MEVPRSACQPSPCGANAKCSEQNGVPKCSCIEKYHGDPYTLCRPECLLNNDCPVNKACKNMVCYDPCPGSCGFNAICEVINHIPTCACKKGYFGQPFQGCQKYTPCKHFQEDPKTDSQDFCPILAPEKPKNPCVPSPCGPNSNCKVVENRPVCACLPGYLGGPPYCRPECTLSAECPLDKACKNTKCINPCLGVCGTHSICKVVNHSPYCTCPEGYKGNPFISCVPEESKRNLTPIEKDL